MATTYTTVTAWMPLSIDPEVEYGGKVPSGASGEAASGFEWARQSYTVHLYRLGQGLTSYAPLTGTTTTGDNITFTSGGDTIAANEAYKYECIDNNLYAEAPGIWREEIVWRWTGEWAQVPTETDDLA